jgi:hypothetical protein
MPLSVKQAVAYRETTKKVQLAYAEEDRATKSPLDTSSPNTMLGSIVYGLVPYTYSLYSNTSISNTLATIGKIVTGSFSTVFQPMTAGATSGDGSEYKLCDDPSIKDNDVAAGPFCNIMYGIPTEYLDKDPVSVLDNLVKSGDVDINTGEPIPEKGLAKWVSLCTDGSTMQAQNCKINDETRAAYALYTVDHRIQKSMDEDPPSLSGDASSGSASGSDSSSTDTTTPTDTSKLDGKTKQDLAKDIIATGHVVDRSDGGQLKKIAAGDSTKLSINILKILAVLAVNNKFTIASLVRFHALSVGAGLKSPHLKGHAVDISGSSGINGVSFGYGGHSSTIQKFLDQASGLLGGNCGSIGVPNSKFVHATSSSCSVFVDIGTGAHIHIGVGS